MLGLAKAAVDGDTLRCAADYARMLGLAKAQPGFISFKSYTADDGEVVAISEWASEAAAHAWGTHPDLVAVQQRGRDRYFEYYTSFSCVDPRVSRFER
jgi:heme-degrading monooxygenase HmoA